ncbi:SDR family NAD(P)-dependent oxidoreductase [Lentzea alba]|uniref:SDR family NAD(P)-dependent oxidoreductase n=1 Tax=Lentzea alba TaxID=2714351 RepID=UPI0039BED91B
MTTAPPAALVTGASSGIGKAATLAPANAGFRVVGTSRDTSRITPSDGVTFLDLDVTSDESVSAVVGQVLERFGRLDVLVNNAGVGANGAAEEISVAQAQTVEGYSESLDHEVREHGIQVLRVQPGPINTPFDARVIATAATDPDPKRRYTAGSTAARVSVLRRVAPAWVFDRSVRKLNRTVG